MAANWRGHVQGPAAALAVKRKAPAKLAKSLWLARQAEVLLFAHSSRRRLFIFLVFFEQASAENAPSPCVTTAPGLAMTLPAKAMSRPF